MIGRYDVYFDNWHLSNSYAQYLKGPLAQALQLPQSTDAGDNISPTTALTRPSTGSVLTGRHVILDANASDNISVRKVQFVLTGDHFKSVIGIGASTSYGFAFVWNSTSVPNGSYTLQSRATDEAGNTKYSSPIAVTIQN